MYRLRLSADLLANFDGLWWLALLLGPLLILQRWLHREIQAIFLIITRRGEISLALFSLLFFPGVLLHESSHFVMALLLGVRTGRVSLLPKPLKDGRLQLGFVETSSTDFIRDAAIGFAPLVVGGAFVAYAGLVHLELPSVWESLRTGDVASWLEAFHQVSVQPDFWLWFYLIFTISSTMLPSSADRRGWLPLALMGAVLIGLSLLAGAGPWLVQNLAPQFNQFLRAVAAVFGISVAVHMLLLFPLWLFRRLLSQITGLRVVG